MAIQKLNQLQITGSLTAGYNDSVGTDASEVAPSIGAAMKISPSLLVDMNNIRALVKDIKGGSNWYDAAPNDVDLAQLTTHINASAGHGVNGLVLKSGIISDTDSTDDIGASGTAFRKLYVDDIDLNGQGDISIGGTGRIDLDANDNTSIRASADDVITIEVGGADKLDIIATAIHPESDALMDLGTSAIGFNDLHLGSGGIINLDGGDVTLTHAAGKVTLGGDGAVEFDFGNHEMTNVDIDSGAIDGVTIGSNSAATALVVNGGVNIDDGGDGAIDGCVIGANTAAAGTFTAVVGTTGVYSGILKTDDATDATSKTDGSLQTDGGLSVAKAIYNGTAATLAADSGVVTIGSSTAAVFSAAGKLAINSTVEATSTTDGSLQTDGGLSVAKDVVAGNDLKLKSDSAELVFGAGDDVKLVHTNDVGLHLNDGMRLGFRDQGGEYIYSVSDNVLGIVAANEIDLTATDIDINGAVDISGNAVIGGNLTVNGVTTTLDTTNLSIEDSIIALGVSGSSAYSASGQRGILFPRGANGYAAVPGFWWDGTQFNLAESATGPASGSFASVSGYNSLKLGHVLAGSDSAFDLGADTVAFRKLYVDDIDLNGVGRIDFDADADTSIRSTQDDVLVFEAGAADVMTLTVQGLQIADDKGLVFGTNNDVVVQYDEDGNDVLEITGANWRYADDIKLQFGTGGDSSIEYDEDGDDVLQIAGANVRIGHGAATQLQFRDSAVHISSDADGVMNVQADSSVHLNVNGTDELALTATTATFGGNIVVADNATLGNASIGGMLSLAAAAVNVNSGADFDILKVSGLKLAGTAVTSIAAEINLLDGGTSVGGSIVIADGDGIFVNDGGTSKLQPMSDVVTYIQAQLVQKAVVEVTGDVAANADVDLTFGVDGDWTDAPAAQKEIYLNGQLLVEGANAGSNKDWYPGGSAGRVKFEFPLAQGDVIQAILRAG